MKKSPWQIFWRTLALGLTAVTLPVLLISGIAVADRNTRKVGFAGREPAFFIEKADDGSLTLSLFGEEISLSAEATKAKDKAVGIYKTAMPHAVKTGAAFIEMIVDRILRSVFPAR